MAVERHDAAEEAERAAWGDLRRPNPRDRDKWDAAAVETTRASQHHMACCDSLALTKKRRAAYEEFALEERITYAIHLAEGRD